MTIWETSKNVINLSLASSKAGPSTSVLFLVFDLQIARRVTEQTE